jgi:hypothetical protein
VIAYTVTEIVTEIVPTFFSRSASIEKKFEFFEVLWYNHHFEEFEVLIKEE